MTTSTALKLEAGNSGVQSFFFLSKFSQPAQSVVILRFFWSRPSDAGCFFVKKLFHGPESLSRIIDVTIHARSQFHMESGHFIQISPINQVWKTHTSFLPRVCNTVLAHVPCLTPFVPVLVLLDLHLRRVAQNGDLAGSATVMGARGPVHSDGCLALSISCFARFAASSGSHVTCHTCFFFEIKLKRDVVNFVHDQA